MGEGEAVVQGETCTLESSHIPTRPDPLLFALLIHGGCTFEGGKRSMKAGVPFNGRRREEAKSIGHGGI